MLAKKYRLPSSFFKKVEKERTRPIRILTETLFSAKLFSSPHAYARFAAVASIAQFKKSVVRNKARRRAYEAIRKSEIYKIKKIDCVLYLKSPILEATPETIQIKLKNILE